MSSPATVSAEDEQVVDPKVKPVVLGGTAVFFVLVAGWCLVAP